jgi:hypothetical protein
MWAERVTIQGATGFSPYRIMHGVDLLFLFDLAKATYLVPPLDTPMTTAELLAIRAQQLQKREEDLEKIEERVMKSQRESAEKFMAKFGSLVIRTSGTEWSHLPLDICSLPPGSVLCPDLRNSADHTGR